MSQSDLDRHVIDRLAAHLEGELDAVESQRVAEHILCCPSCRKAYERVRLSLGLARQLPRYEAPRGLWEQLEARLDTGGIEPASNSAGRPRRRSVLPWAAAAAALLAAVAVSTWVWQTSAPQPQLVYRLEGTPLVGERPVSAAAPISEGEFLTTDPNSRARIEIPQIGAVEVLPRSRLRLLKSSRVEHRLALEVGRIEATISAPPRVFLVETPGALAVDLGCAYMLDVDEAGGGLLQVEAGWVGLEHPRRQVVVPGGAACRIDRKRGPGYPYVPDASPEFLQLLRDLEARTAASADTARLLTWARPRDALSLWYLAQDVNGEVRAGLTAGMLELAPPSDVGIVEALGRGDAHAWLLWRDHLEQLAAR